MNSCGQQCPVRLFCTILAEECWSATRHEQQQGASTGKQSYRYSLLEMQHVTFNFNTVKMKRSLPRKLHHIAKIIAITISELQLVHLLQRNCISWFDNWKDTSIMLNDPSVYFYFLAKRKNEMSGCIQYFTFLMLNANFFEAQSHLHKCV